MNKKGFTLVELMVVIVIIGVLAAVAIPKMMAATNKAKASEGPQMIGSIANLEHAFGAEYGQFAQCQKGVTLGWEAIGMGTKGDPNTGAKYFEYEVSGAAGTTFPDYATAFNTIALKDFNVIARLIVKLGDATAGNYVLVNDEDAKKVSSKELGGLIGSYGATAP